MQQLCSPPGEGPPSKELASQRVTLRAPRPLLLQTPTQWLSPILLYTTLKFVPFKVWGSNGLDK